MVIQMGKMKDKIIDYEEKDWLKEEQEKILNDIHRDISITYADLLTLDDIKKSNKTYITMMNSTIYDFQFDEVIELNALSIKIDYGLGQTVVLPLDKIIAVKYVV